MDKFDFSHNLEDFNLDSQIYHDVERKALEILKDRYKKEKGLTEEQFLDNVTFREFGNPKDFFVEAFSFDEVDKVYREVEEQLRKDYISRMKFTQQYKDQRHIGDLKYAEREMDASYAIGMQNNLEGISQTGETISNDIGAINIEKIFDAYIALATQYNIEDSEQLRNIIERTIQNPQQGVLVDEFSNLIHDDNVRNAFLSLFKDSQKKLETFDKAISLASTDANSRMNAIRGKIELLEYFSQRFPQLMNNYHGSTISQLEEAIRRVQNGMENPESIMTDQFMNFDNQESYEYEGHSKSR